MTRKRVVVWPSLKFVRLAFERGRQSAFQEAAGFAREAWEYHNDPKTEQRPGFGDGARGVALRLIDRIELRAKRRLP